MASPYTETAFGFGKYQRRKAKKARAKLIEKAAKAIRIAEKRSKDRAERRKKRAAKKLKKSSTSAPHNADIVRVFHPFWQQLRFILKCQHHSLLSICLFDV